MHDRSVIAATLAARIAAARRVLVLSGAGMSAESGIATFRGGDHGLWTRFDPQTLATPEAWQVDASLVWGWYRWRMAGVRDAQPHAGHCAIAAMASRVALAVVTQNVDDLHERAGSVDVVHLHGELFALRCDRCGTRADEPPPRTDAGATERETPPTCACGGRVRPGVVWFGESLPEAAWGRAVAHAGACDVVLVVGTSGLVQPAASLPGLARRAGAFVVEINPQPGFRADEVDLHWRDTAAHALPALAVALDAQLAEASG